jgi:Mg/Co/Ni transporter MgtE
MNAKEIVDKFKSILLSDVSEEVKETPVFEAEEVKLEEQENLGENYVEKETEEEAVEDVVEVEEKYATKEELAKALAEMKAMYDQIMESMSTEEAVDAPEELSEEPKKEELSSQEEVAPLIHSPEEAVSSKPLNLYAQKRAATTFDLVLSKISKQ